MMWHNFRFRIALLALLALLTPVVGRAQDPSAMLTGGLYSPSGGTVSGGIQWTDSIDGIERQKADFLQRIQLTCPYVTTVISSVTHQQTMTYYWFDGSTVAATKVLQWDGSHRRVTGISKATLYSLPSSFTGPVSDATVIQTVLGNSLTWAKWNKMCVSAAVGLMTTSGSAQTYYNQASSGALFTMTLTQGSAGSASRSVSINWSNL